MSKIVDEKGSLGQSLLELGLLLPILILILAGALDLARVYDAYVSITNASREGARFAAANPTDDGSGIQNAVSRELTNTGIAGVTVNWSCSKYADGSSILCDTAVAGDRIKVSVGYNFRFVAFLIIGLNSVNMSNSTTMPVGN
jgi:Flp pilus assembly protein TadG